MAKPKDGDNIPEAAREIANYVSRIERLKEEAKPFAEDIKEVYAEAKNRGFNTKVLREIIKRRSKKKEEIEQFDSDLAIYETNLDSVLE